MTFLIRQHTFNRGDLLAWGRRNSELTNLTQLTRPTNNHLIPVESKFWKVVIDMLIVFEVARFFIANVFRDDVADSLGGTTTILITEAIITLMVVVDSIEWLRFLGVENTIMVYRMEQRFNIMFAMVLGLVLHLWAEWGDLDASQEMKLKITGEYLRGVVLTRILHRINLIDRGAYALRKFCKGAHDATAPMAARLSTLSTIKHPSVFGGRELLKSKTQVELRQNQSKERSRSSAGRDTEGRRTSNSQRTKPHISRVLSCLNHVRAFVKFAGSDDVKLAKQLLAELDWSIQTIQSGKLNITIIDTQNEKSMAFITQTLGTQKRISVTDTRPKGLKGSAVEEENFDVNYGKDVDEILAGGLRWDFDPFTLNEASGKHPVVALGHWLFEKYEIYERLGISKRVAINWFNMIEEGYPDNPYHNRIHATDVCQTLMFMVEAFGLRDHLGHLDMFALICAALAHDYLHVGKSNQFLIKTSDPLALRYNDTSVLEAYAVAEMFAHSADKKRDCNIFASLGAEDFQTVRSTVVRLILATDLQHHFGSISTLKGRMETRVNFNDAETQSSILDALLHFADISNLLKPFPMAKQWANLVMAEFRNQGREELSRGMKLSLFMDPNGGEAMLNECQAGFLEYFVVPLAECLFKLVETAKPQYRGAVLPLQEHLNINLETYKQAIQQQEGTKAELVDDFDEKADNLEAKSKSQEGDSYMEA